QGAERVAYHYALPAQERQRHVVRIAEVASFVIGGQQVVRPHAASEVRLVRVAAGARSAFVEYIGDQTLRSAREVVGLVFPGGVFPAIGRALERAGAGGDELRV